MWFNHFQSVLGTEPTNAQPVVTDEADPVSVEELSSPITESETTRAVEHLETNKSPGMDGIYADMIKNSLSVVFSIHVNIPLHGQVQLLSRYIKVAIRTTLITIGSVITEYYGRDFCPHLE